jgi:GTP pyrophosphokinase
VTKLQRIEGAEKTDDPRHINSLKKMFFATAEDIRVILIKLADRCHNMQTLEYKDPESQIRIARDTMDIYAPIAERLGMGQVKGQLEDLAFKYINSEEYSWLMKKIKDKYTNRLEYIEEIKPVIKKQLLSAGIKILDIHSRVKHIYSLYKKLFKYDKDPNRVYDLVAMRIIVPDIKTCYETMGIIHKHYRPLPGLVKDYIAMPKPSGYQSLHTTIFCEGGKIVEIQIRTPEMHDFAENGIAAHWAYSESGKKGTFKPNQKEIQWISELRKFLKDIGSGEEVETLKSDFLRSRIFVFTPRGQIKDLPRGSTPIDFAYSIHEELGHRARGARVNQKMVPIDYELHSGEVVEIIKGKEIKPSRDWLGFVKTSEAKRRIKSWFKENSTYEKVKEKIINLGKRNRN